MDNSFNIPDPGDIIVDNNAKREDKGWSKYGELRGIQDGEHGLILDHLFFIISCWVIKVLAVLFCIIVCVWVWHIVTPNKWQWLAQRDLQDLERIIFASALVSVAGKYFSKYNLFNNNK